MENASSGETAGNSEPGESRVPGLGEIGLNNFAPYVMNRIMARWNANLAEDLKAREISTIKMRALAVLHVSGSLTINELSVLAVTEQSTMSRTIDALDEQGLIQRTPRADDMRIRDVTITQQGRAVFEDVWPIMYRDLGRMFHGIGEDEQLAFIATLHKILRNIRRHEI